MTVFKGSIDQGAVKLLFEGCAKVLDPDRGDVIVELTRQDTQLLAVFLLDVIAPHDLDAFRTLKQAQALRVPTLAPGTSKTKGAR